MEEYEHRKIKFKVWDSEHRLLLRMNTIECKNGELLKKHHVFLQFTGLLDKNGEEIYDRDILMISVEKYVVFWSEINNGWCYAPLEKRSDHARFLAKVAATMKRFSNYYELNASSNDMNF